MVDRLDFEINAELETGLITGRAGIVKLRIDAGLGDAPEGVFAMSWTGSAAVVPVDPVNSPSASPIDGDGSG